MWWSGSGGAPQCSMRRNGFQRSNSGDWSSELLGFAGRHQSNQSAGRQWGGHIASDLVFTWGSCAKALPVLNPNPDHHQTQRPPILHLKHCGTSTKKHPVSCQHYSVLISPHFGVFDRAPIWPALGIAWLDSKFLSLNGW